MCRCTLRTVTVALFLLAAPTGAHGQPALSGFEGSTLLGTYESEYDRLAWTNDLAMDGPVQAVEGALLARVFENPEGRSNLEVFRSYERELAEAGFEVHFASALPSQRSFRLSQIYGPPHTPSARERVYTAPDGSGRSSEISYVTGLADHYLIASRSRGGEERWVALLTSGSRPYYMVEELTLESMEEGTVTLDLEAMRSEIASAGIIAVYDIHFATGSAEIEPRSAGALAVIAEYLNETPGGFYIVGHTDDTGSLESNLQLSDARAAAVKEALVREHAIDASRLETRGVGPLVPVSLKTDEAGRALNRRVEIVQRLR